MTAAPVRMQETARRRANDPGHGTGGIAPMQGEGYCECGCGEKTPPAKRSNAHRGHVKGRPLRYVPGHQGRAPKVAGSRWVEEDRGYETPCWVWQLSRDVSGYGQVKVHYRARKAHRVIYEERHGAVPDGLELDHLCRVRECVNPDHLEAVTSAENSRRGDGTKLAEADVRRIRRLLAEGFPVTHIAHDFGVSPTAIHSIKSGRHWRDVR